MCGHHRHHASRHRYDHVTAAPRYDHVTAAPRAQEPQWVSQPDLRASDAEREEVAVALRDHGAAGRLGVEELDERLDRAYAARTHGDLAALLRDLPAPPRRPASSGQRQPDVHDAVRAYVLVNLLLVAIWLATGAGYFWPIWVIIGWGFGLVPAIVAHTAHRNRRPTLTI